MNWRHCRTTIAVPAPDAEEMSLLRRAAPAIVP